MAFVHFIEKNKENQISIDPFSKLFQNRIIFIEDCLEDDIMVNAIIAQLLYLDSINNERIDIYINGPGGPVLNGLAIYDVGKAIKSPIRTTCIGMAASMHAILMLMGSERRALPHARLMLHETNHQLIGSNTDVKISLQLGSDLQDDLYRIISKETLVDVKTLDRDRWFNREEAFQAGILTQNN